MCTELLTEKCDGNRPVRRPSSSKYRDNIKLDFKAVEWKFVDWAENCGFNNIRC